MNGSEILSSIEEHCQEKLSCSKRMRFHITQAIQRLIDKESDLRSNISSVLDGKLTYDPKTQKPITKSKS